MSEYHVSTQGYHGLSRVVRGYYQRELFQGYSRAIQGYSGLYLGLFRVIFRVIQGLSQEVL